MARLRSHTATASGQTFKVWGKTEDVQDVFPDLQPDNEQTSQMATTNVKSVSVRRYPGGPTFTRAGHARTFDKNLGISGGATPGRRFWVERQEGIGPLARKVVRQFTFTGPVYALKAYARAELLPGSVLRTPGGRAIPINAPD